MSEVSSEADAAPLFGRREFPLNKTGGWNHMSKATKKPLKITETVLRDAHQSLIATRMTTEQMLPIIDKMDQVGYHAVECWG